MSIVGNFAKTSTGFKGAIKTLKMDLPDVQLHKIEGSKTNSKAPDYRVFVEGVECGAGWIKPYGEDGKKTFVSAALDDPSLPNALNFSLFASMGNKAGFDAIWNRPRSN